tara:strand:+ start:2448 stop:2735 length:288 start_codon:yes stop_codon:yes gene_type:complete
MNIIWSIACLLLSFKISLNWALVLWSAQFAIPYVESIINNKKRKTFEANKLELERKKAIEAEKKLDEQKMMNARREQEILDKLLVEKFLKRAHGL